MSEQTLMPPTPFIAMRGLYKAFDGKPVLKGLDLDIRRGESLVIIGGSGSGKSVTLKTLLGLLTPDRGSIVIDGQETIGMTDKARSRLLERFGMLFQGAALFDSLPVWQNVAFPLLRQSGMTRARARDLACERLVHVGLGAEILDIMPAALSAGMQKCVGLARAIAINPDVILFDEPTTGLDPLMGKIISQLIASSVRELGATAVTITHDMRSARTIADRIAMIYRGSIQWIGPVAMIDQSGDPIIDQFIHGRDSGPIELDIRSA